jgi:hypothetical protein
VNIASVSPWYRSKIFTLLYAEYLSNFLKIKHFSHYSEKVDSTQPDKTGLEISDRIPYQHDLSDRIRIMYIIPDQGNNRLFLLDEWEKWCSYFDTKEKTRTSFLSQE